MPRWEFDNGDEGRMIHPATKTRFMRRGIALAHEDTAGAEHVPKLL